MSAPQMVCHLSESLKMALGELKVTPKKLPIRYPPLKQFIVYVAPFPKHAPTAPELQVRSPGDWSADVADLRSLVERFASQRGVAKWPDHPAFGRLSARAWGVLVYRHMDHHLRQFDPSVPATAPSRGQANPSEASASVRAGVGPRRQ
jgi:hypothetical protein